MNPRDHQKIGWIYFIMAWLSLFIINGIVGFMLTPGGWSQSGNFWAGFFNPSFLPGLAYRTFLAFILAGLFALVTVDRIPDPAVRKRMVRYAAVWTAWPFILLLGLPPTGISRPCPM